MTSVANGMRSEAFASVLTAAATGAPWALKELWIQYSPAVHGFLRARGSAEPEDLTSEVFLTVFDALPRFSGGEGEFRSFVFTIAYRRLVDELRARSRRPPHVEWADHGDPRRALDAETEALTSIGDQQTRRLLDSLAPDQRDVLVLRIIADLTVEEVATILGKRVGAVKALQRRGLDALRKKISPARTLFSPADDSEK